MEEDPMDQSIKSRYIDAITSILNYKACFTHKDLNPYTLRIESDALNIYKEFAKAVETMMHPDLDYLSHITDWGSKLSGQIIRIAGALHIFRYAFSNPWEERISIIDMQNAVKIGNCLIKHALVVFNPLSMTEEEVIAQDILHWIKNSLIGEFTQRDCLRKLRKYRKEKIKLGINVLKDRYYLHETIIKRSKGASSIRFEVNPQLFLGQ